MRLASTGYKDGGGTPPHSSIHHTTLHPTPLHPTPPLDLNRGPLLIFPGHISPGEISHTPPWAASDRQAGGKRSAHCLLATALASLLISRAWLQRVPERSHPLPCFPRCAPLDHGGRQPPPQPPLYLFFFFSPSREIGRAHV